MKAVAYARFSSSNQREESIDAQMDAIRAYAAREGVSIIRIYTDHAESARTDDRPAFLSMMEEMKTLRPDVILVHKTDRFARDRIDAAYHRYNMKKQGVKLVCVDQLFADTAEGRFMEGIMDAVAQYHSDNLSNEVMKGLRQNAKNGLWNGGKPPIGYKVNSDRKLSVDEATAPVVRNIFDLFVRGYGYQAIASELNRTGIPTGTGGTWYKNSVYDVLVNEKYHGIHAYNKREAKRMDGTRNNRNVKPDSEIIRVPCPAIIDDKTWEEVKSKMEGRRRGPRPTAKRMYLLTGLMFCGECGSSYVGAGYRKKPEYTIYSCTKRQTHACSNPAINQDTIEGHVIRELQERVFNDAAIDRMVPLLLEELFRRGSGFLQERDNVRQLIKETQGRISRLLDAIEDGTAPEDVGDRLRKRRADLDELRDRELFLNDQACAQADHKTIRAFLVEHRKNLDSTDPVKQRKTIETFVEKVVVFLDRYECHFRIESVSDNGGGGEPLWTVSLTIGKKVPAAFRRQRVNTFGG